MQRGVALALPLPAPVPHAQTLQQVSAGVRLGPRVSNSVRLQDVLVVTAIWGGNRKMVQMNPQREAIKTGSLF